MLIINIDDIILATNGKLLIGHKETIVKGISIDSRNVYKDYLFIPIIGERLDGHSFINDAFNKGATIALTSKDINIEEYNNKTIIKVKDTTKALQDISKYFLEKLDIPVIAVTGSTGKTTTKEMIYSVLSQRYNVLRNEGNFNNHIGLPLTLLKLDYNHEIIVLEMGMSHRGEIDLLAKLTRPKVGIITNIGLSHIENLGSQEEIYKAKMEISNYMNRDSILILNGDDDFLRRIIDEKTVYNKFFVGLKENNDIYPTEIVMNEKYYPSFNIKIKNKKYNVKLNVSGAHNINNALLAIIVGLNYNIPVESIIKGIENYKGSNMRLNIISIKDNISIINDCYNASPDSMKSAIEVLTKIKSNSKIAVLGDMLEMGEFADNSHYEIGKICFEKKVDIIVAIGEKARFIAKGALDKGFKKDNIYTIKDNNEASQILDNVLRPNDVVLIKGSRGMKMEEIVQSLQERS